MFFILKIVHRSVKSCTFFHISKLYLYIISKKGVLLEYCTRFVVHTRAALSWLPACSESYQSRIDDPSTWRARSKYVACTPRTLMDHSFKCFEGMANSISAARRFSSFGYSDMPIIYYYMVAGRGRQARWWRTC